MVEKVDQIHLWHMNYRIRETGGDRVASDFPEAINFSDEEMLIISDTQDTEEVLQKEEEEIITLPINLNQGCPDYRTIWVAGSQFKSRTRCSAEQLCGQFTHVSAM